MSILKNILLRSVLILTTFFLLAKVTNAQVVDVRQHLLVGDNLTQFNGWNGIWVAQNGGTFDARFYISWTIDLNKVPHSSLVLDTCSTIPFTNQGVVSRTYKVGTACPENCFSNTISVISLNNSCTTNAGYVGQSYRIFIPVSKWYFPLCDTEDPQEGTRVCTSTLDDKITFKNNNSYSGVFDINDAYFSDDLIMSSTDTQAINNVNTSINNLTSAINNQGNTAHQDSLNAQAKMNEVKTALENAINGQKTQQHSDSLNEQQKLDDLKDQLSNAIGGLNSNITSDNVDSVNSKASEWASKSLSDNAIAGLLVLPINLITAFNNNLNGSCSSFSLGVLFGHELTMPCVNISSYFGTTLWSVIDVLFSGFMILAISKKFVKIFNDFTNLKDTQVNELYGGGA